MNLLRSLLWLLVFGSVLSPGHAQRTWKVWCVGGPGIDYTDLPPAVAAAAPGDTILVWHDSAMGCTPAGQVQYTAATIDKPLSVVGMFLSPQGLPLGTMPIGAGLGGVLRVTNLAAGDRVVLCNLSIGNWAPVSAGFELSNCDGEVILDGCSVDSLGEDNVVTSIVDCANVFMHGCRVDLSGTTVGITNSTVTMSLTSISPVPPLPQLGHAYTQSVPGVTLVNSSLTLTGSYIRGSDGYTWPGYGWPFYPIHTREGVQMDNSTLYIGPGTGVAAGSDSLGSGGGSVLRASWSTPPGVVHRDPRAVLVGIVNVPTVVEYLHATYSFWAVATQNLGAYVVGPPDGFALLLFGDYQMSPLPTPFGDLLLDANALTFVDLLALPSTSWVYREYYVPSTVQYGHAYGLQALTLSPAGELALGLPTAFTVAWEPGRIP